MEEDVDNDEDDGEDDNEDDDYGDYEGILNLRNLRTAVSTKVEKIINRKYDALIICYRYVEGDACEKYGGNEKKKITVNKSLLQIELI